jgi:endonuclease III
LTEAANLLKTPEKLGELGYDRLARLITERRSLPWRRSERIKKLSDILNQLEETN